MKKIDSNQRNVRFVFCPSPITIDKRSEWGNNDENFQKAPNGAFLKYSSDTEVSHLVQPNNDRTAPVGWIVGDEPGLFHKSPIWVDENILQPGTTKELSLLDGDFVYEVVEPSMVCYNDLDGQPNLNDGWVQKVSQISKNYALND
jgi:hypothetical protein